VLPYRSSATSFPLHWSTPSHLGAEWCAWVCSCGCAERVEAGQTPWRGGRPRVWEGNHHSCQTASSFYVL